MHTDIASLNAHHDELEIILSLIKFDFQIIGITEHKISDLTALLFILPQNLRMVVQVCMSKIMLILK